MSNWVLPDHIADVLPSKARHMEEIRRTLLDRVCVYGYELVIPPLIEHLESLLTGTGSLMDLYTFKLVDQVSGRLLGVRADMTPQLARIDAHLLNRQGVCRLSYCGPTLHAKAELPWSSREQLQFGAEIFGQSGREAELEVIQMSIDCLLGVGVGGLVLDLSHAGLVRSLMTSAYLSAHQCAEVSAALAMKDRALLTQLCEGLTPALKNSFLELIDAYGDIAVLKNIQKYLPDVPEITMALSEMEWLASRVTNASISFDLADMRGHTYYTGVRFVLFASGVSNAVARGGRYDDVGKEFGRSRPACGMSLDIRMLAEISIQSPPKSAIRSHWIEDFELKKIVEALRKNGETVVSIFPSDDASEFNEFQCDRELVLVDGIWVVKKIEESR
jgi:ATP phosphoribosyltransferase regulatory subunit